MQGGSVGQGRPRNTSVAVWGLCEAAPPGPQDLRGRRGRTHPGARSGASCAAVPPARAGQQHARPPPPGSRGSSGGGRPEALGRGRAPWGPAGQCPTWMLQAHVCPPHADGCLSQEGSERKQRFSECVLGTLRGTREVQTTQRPTGRGQAARATGRVRARPAEAGLWAVFRTARFSVQTVSVDRTHTRAPGGPGRCGSRGPGTEARAPRPWLPPPLHTPLRPSACVLASPLPEPRAPGGAAALPTRLTCPNGWDEPEA